MKAELKTSELRLGNYIQVEGKISKIDGIQPHWVWFDNISSSNMDNIKPIPLDEAWLNKLGFEFVEEASGYCNKNHMMVISKTDDSMIFMPFCTNDDDCYITVNYVHEVQNICFVFGEELTVSM